MLSAHFALMQCVRNRAISDTVGIHVKLRRAVLSDILYSRESGEKVDLTQRFCQSEEFISITLKRKERAGVTLRMDEPHWAKQLSRGEISVHSLLCICT